MKHSCNICRYDLGFPIYTSSDNVSITTMCKKIAGKSKVYYCEKCGHLQTSELANLAEYYAAEYEVNLHSEDDDQMYEVAGDEIVYRTDKQAEVTLSKINVVESTKILDFGCAKASTLKQIATRNPNVVPYAFDVTDHYCPVKLFGTSPNLFNINMLVRSRLFSTSTSMYTRISDSATATQER